MDVEDMIGELVTTSGARLLRLAYQPTRDAASAGDVGRDALTGRYRGWMAELVDARESSVRSLAARALAALRARPGSTAPEETS